MSKSALIIVNHLMGAGHLARALNLGRAFRDDGYDTHVLTGGFPVPQFDHTGMTLHQMPPLKSDGADFSRLLTLDEDPVDDVYHQSRINTAITVMKEITPDVLVFELFPFGRRNLKHEYLAILDETKNLSKLPKIVCSIRDILSPPSKPSKVEFAEDVLERWFDLVLVHSVETVVPLDLTWPVSDKIRSKIKYTGFVAPPMNPPSASIGDGEILVSTGSGSFADPIFETALQAAQSTAGSKFNWRLLVGRADAKRLKYFQDRAAANVIVEATRPDFRDLLQNATAAVSLCGYNSAMDLLQSGTPTVIVPYDERSETEQATRANALATLPGVARVAYADLTPSALLAALEVVLAAPKRGVEDIGFGSGFDGAQETVRICNNMLR